MTIIILMPIRRSCWPQPALTDLKFLGLPRRKPKHFEVLGRRRDEFNELHIDLDGHIRKSKLITKGDPKWSSELSAAKDKAH